MEADHIQDMLRAGVNSSRHRLDTRNLHHKADVTETKPRFQDYHPRYPQVVRIVIMHHRSKIIVETRHQTPSDTSLYSALAPYFVFNLTSDSSPTYRPCGSLC